MLRSFTAAPLAALPVLFCLEEVVVEGRGSSIYLPQKFDKKKLLSIYAQNITLKERESTREKERYRERERKREI